ncbi:MAG: FadR family transcriptional regulator [Rhodobacteraceae bacterium]|nr:FadR family transcriptional regulator [Paracoccaceae bacterium]
MDLTVQPPWDLDEQIRKPVTPKTRKLADSLFSAICEGVYRFGTRLPAERALCLEYSMSRNTIRQALDLLDQYNVIKRHAGSGSVVCYRHTAVSVPTEPVIEKNAPSLDLSEIGELMSPLELGVVRSIVEPEIARLAVLSMSSRDIQQMNRIQEQIERVTIDGEQYCDLDDKLRMQIARGTHNPMLIVIYQMINHVNQTADWAARRRKSLTPRRIKEYQLQSKALCDAINNREIEATVENLKLSLAEFHQDLTKGL